MSGQQIDQQQDDDNFSFQDNHGNTYKVPKVIEVEGKEVPLQALFGHAISKSRKDTQSKLEQKYAEVINEFNSIKQEYETTKTKLEEVETNGLSKKDQEVLTLKKQLEQYEKEKKQATEAAQKNFEQFKSEKIRAEVFAGLSGHSLHNQDQTAKLFLADAHIDFQQDDEGNYKTTVKMTLPNEKGEYTEVSGSPKDVFGKWIAMGSNSYLLKNNLQPGGGTSKTGATRTTSGQLAYKRSDMQNEAVRKEYQEKLKQGMDVSIIPD